MRRLAYHYLILWPALAVIFVAVLDYSSQEYCKNRMRAQTESYLTNFTHITYESVKRFGPEVLDYPAGDFEGSIEIYIADDEQRAVSKPKYAKTGTTVTSKSITRALSLSPGDVETWSGSTNYRGVPVITAYTCIEINGDLCALICEVPLEDALGVTFAWWFYADIAWIFFFSTIAGLCVYALRFDIIRVLHPVVERSKSGFSMLIQAVMQFPVKSVGVALVDDGGTIKYCNPGMANILGAVLTREVTDTFLTSYLVSETVKAALIESSAVDVETQSAMAIIKTDVVDRPVTLRKLSGELIDASVSVTKLDGLSLVVLRAQ